MPMDILNPEMNAPMMKRPAPPKILLPEPLPMLPQRSHGASQLPPLLEETSTSHLEWAVI